MRARRTCPASWTIFNHAVRETFSIWSETETTLEQRRAWLAARRGAGFPVLVAIEFRKPETCWAMAASACSATFLAM